MQLGVLGEMANGAAAGPTMHGGVCDSGAHVPLGLLRVPCGRREERSVWRLGVSGMSTASMVQDNPDNIARAGETGSSTWANTGARGEADIPTEFALPAPGSAEAGSEQMRPQRTGNKRRRGRGRG